MMEQIFFETFKQAKGLLKNALSLVALLIELKLFENDFHCKQFVDILR